MGDNPAPLIAPTPRSLRTFVPILAWLPTYRWSRDLPADLVAGIAVAALLIPESMGYAGVGGVPPQVGLYAALAAVVAYALTGGTKILVVGPASAVAALSASVVAEVGGGTSTVVLTAGLAVATGMLLIAAGLLRLGWIVNFISHPVLHGFVAGLSMSIIIGQLDGLFGIAVKGESAVAKLVDVVRQIGQWHGPSVAVGLGAVAALLLLERVVERIPAAVVVVVVGIILVGVLDLPGHGVAVVGNIPQGLPVLAVPDLGATRWLELLAGAAALLLVGFSEGYASASAVSPRSGPAVDADQELVGSGVANLASGLFGGLAVSGSLSKSSAAQAAGARSQVANLAAGVLVLATLLFLAPVFERLPEPVLAAVVIVAVLRSADSRRVSRLWRVNRLDFAAGLVTLVLVLVWETLPAMIVGVLLSLAFVVRRASFPDVVQLRRATDGSYRAHLGPGLTWSADRPDVAVVRFEAPLIYANAERLRQAVRAVRSQHPGLTRLVLDAEMCADLDSSGSEVLVDLDEDLAQDGIELALARLHERARAQLGRSGLEDCFAGRIYPGVSEAVDPPVTGLTPAG